MLFLDEGNIIFDFVGVGSEYYMYMQVRRVM